MGFLTNIVTAPFKVVGGVVEGAVKGTKKAVDDIADSDGLV